MTIPSNTTSDEVAVTTSEERAKQTIPIIASVVAGGGMCPRCGHGEYDTVADGKIRQNWVAICRGCGHHAKASAWLKAEQVYLTAKDTK